MPIKQDGEKVKLILSTFRSYRFNQNGVNIAQVLLTKPDFYNPINRVNLKWVFDLVDR